MVPALATAAALAPAIGERPVLPFGNGSLARGDRTASQSPPSPIGFSSASGDTQVQDAPLPPRRRSGDGARAPGFPASPFLAQLIAQEAFPPDDASSANGIAAYRVASLRSSAQSGNVISLNA
ncbi:MAG TPA: hypothetical protein VEU47_12260 [Candidatus Cybelea sp.]|nr:hypothetical protein [Candidatus Cybelea sp.]